MVPIITTKQPTCMIIDIHYFIIRYFKFYSQIYFNIIYVFMLDRCRIYGRGVPEQQLTKNLIYV